MGRTEEQKEKRLTEASLEGIEFWNFGRFDNYSITAVTSSGDPFAINS